MSWLDNPIYFQALFILIYVLISLMNKDKVFVGNKKLHLSFTIIISIQAFVYIYHSYGNWSSSLYIPISNILIVLKNYNHL